MLDLSYINALKIISNRFKSSKIPWYITGRTGLNLQGVKVKPDHIGIQVYDYNLIEFTKVFKNFKMTQPVELLNKEGLELKMLMY